MNPASFFGWDNRPAALCFPAFRAALRTKNLRHGDGSKSRKSHILWGTVPTHFPRLDIQHIQPLFVVTILNMADLSSWFGQHILKMATDYLVPSTHPGGFP
jgi:hypothetical protein